MLEIVSDMLRELQQPVHELLDPRAQLLLAVVEMERLDRFQADCLGQGSDRRAIVLFVAQRIAGRERVAGINAHAQPLGMVTA